MSDALIIKRRAMTRAEVIEILLNQGADLFALVQALPRASALREKAIWTLLEQHGVKIPCGNFQSCATLIHARKDCIRDHKIPLRGSPEESRAEHDRPWNQWYLCHSCNRLKTSKRGLTGLGSDAARIAKLRRVEAKAEAKLYAERPASEAKLYAERPASEAKLYAERPASEANVYRERPTEMAKEESAPCPMTAPSRKKTLPSRPFTRSASSFGSSKSATDRPRLKQKIPSRPFPSKKGLKKAK